jgi:flagellar protein FlaJ
MAIAGVIIAPIGVVAFMDDWRIDARDRDIATFVRAMGGVMGSSGLTALDGLSRLNRRSLGSLEPLVQRLYVRLRNSISPDLSWLRLAAESGSELVTRSVRVFWDGVRVGGDTEKVATLSSEFALKIYLLRADRKLVSTTFSFVAIPLHGVLIGILLFVTQVVQIFGEQLTQVQSQSLEGGVAAEAGVGDALLFQAPALGFIPVFVGTVAIMLTAANSFAPYAAAGGHRLKLCLYLAVMMVITGLMMIVVPSMVDALFKSVVDTSVATPAGVPTVSPGPTPIPTVGF